MAQFDIQDLTFAYPERDQRALDGVTLQIERGSYVCVCGLSGCGKTTLLRHLKTVLAPCGQTTGTVLFEGRPLQEVPLADQAQFIGFVMQDPDAQLVTDKVWHELAFGLESLGTDPRVMRLRVAEMASYFGIQDWFHKDVGELSGGQKQLLNLASIMAMQPSVLVLDEPTSQLDPIAAADFLNTVRKINVELGTTVIITEHRLEDVFSTADMVVVMDQGRAILHGAPQKVAQALHERQSAMTFALPAPVRVFYGVAPTRSSQKSAWEERAVPTQDVQEPIPLTVREGRTWLLSYVDAHELPVRSLPDEPVLDRVQEGAGQKPAVQLKDVWFRYERAAPDVLRGVDLEVPQGELFALLGGNGTGKSTLLKCLCGICKPYRGTVRVLGRRLAEWKSGTLFRGGLAMLPQDPQNLFFKKTVRLDLEEMLPDVSRSERDVRIAQVARLCRVEAQLDQHPLDLSGGEQQRAALAKVLLCEPQVLLLDEPTKGIDAFFKRTLAEVLQGLVRSGVAVIMVSHDVEFCARYADSVSLFFDGSVVTTNTPRAFFAMNSFYTTAANRMSRHVFANAVTDEDVIELCRG